MPLPYFVARRAKQLSAITCFNAIDHTKTHRSSAYNHVPISSTRCSGNLVIPGCHALDFSLELYVWRSNQLGFMLWKCRNLTATCET
jgi:hypothetical protein